MLSNVGKKEAKERYKQHKGEGIDPQEQCHIVLHADANNLDILKSALALVILRGKLVEMDAKMEEGMDFPNGDSEASYVPLRSRDCTDVLQEARTEADQIFPQLLRELTKQGWQPPLRSMLGRVSTRAEWPIQRMGGLASVTAVSVKISAIKDGE